MTFDRAVVKAFITEDRTEFHRLIGLKPWETSPLDADTDASPWPAASCGGMSWPRARALRRELLRAAREMKVRK